MPSLTVEYKIVTRIYANLKGLATTFYHAGLVEKPAVVEEFARGFTGSKQLFDFVDVGSGKDRADDKIIEIFKLHLYDCHCRHIFFGCSHDNGYARLLEDLADQPVTGRITLMEGVPFEKELNVLKSKYETTQFQNLFRTDKIKTYQQTGYALQTTLPHQTHPSYSMPPPVLPSPQQQPTPQSGTGLRYHAPSEPQSSNNKSNATPSPILSNAISGSSNAPPVQIKPATWASTTAAAAPPQALVSPPPTPLPAIIPRNKYGQRVDPPSTYNKTEFHRIRTLKLCNLHYLRGDCPYDPCHHDHHYKISKSELATLQYLARMVPCQWGTECDDPKCIYGHKCPANYEGTECRFGAECNFPAEMHGVDGTVVRTTRVGKK
ncbi:MAG: hypothetical protein Q9214_006644 [Letrouitia sp. 1 TL-2023]